jgi:hypothetical protein
MPGSKTLRLAALVAGAAALVATGATATTGPSASPSTTRSVDVRPVSSSYPTNAAKIFRWGDAQWYDNFISPVKPMWHVNHPRLVRDQHGMLTINATATSGTVSATLTRHDRRYGRWEARVRAEQYNNDATPYHVVWELIPTTGYHCGARNIVLSDYALGTSRANMYLRNTPNTQFSFHKSGMALGPGPFHTYAIEVTKHHISWFVDTHVVMTERRAAARTGAKYKVRFSLVGKRGARMNPGRMQMDWVRYYSLARPNAKSIAAPHARLGRYAGSC